MTYRVLQKSILFILFIFVLGIGINLRINNLNNVNLRSPDEKIYTRQANIVALKGIKGIALLIKEYNLSKDLWIYPPPTRVGYILLLANVMRVTDKTDAKVGAYISCAFSIISLLLLILIGVRFFNSWIALYALLFMSVSPMELAIARRTWQDAMFGCVGLSLVYFCCEITRNPKKIIWYILFTMLGSYCVLIKEPGIIIYGLLILWLICILLVKEKSFLKVFLLIIVSVLGLSLSIFALMNLGGGIAPVIEVLKHVKEAMPTNSYAIKYQSGPWYYFLQGIWIVSPMNAILFLVGIACAVFLNDRMEEIVYLPLNQHATTHDGRVRGPQDNVSRNNVQQNNKNRHAILGIIFFTIAFLAIAIGTPYCQNLRYISVLFVPFYLISGLGFWYTVSLMKSMTRGCFFYIITPCIVVTFILGAAGDYRIFKKIFVKKGIRDISIRLLKENSR